MIGARGPSRLIVGILLLLYTVVSLATLAGYPAVHSDEVWLASLTRSMIQERSLAATEDFFSITPRYPHAIKTLYHLLQMPFIAISFSHVAARLPSAIAGIAAVWLLYLITERLTRRPVVAGGVALAFGLDPQVLYIAHLARQEAIVVALTLAAIRVALNRSPLASLWAGVVIGVTIFVHPNAFVAAAAVVPWIVLPGFNGSRGHSRHSALHRYGMFVLPIVVSAVAAVGASFLMDPNFLRHYASFGDSVGVSDSALRRIFRLRSFFEKAIAQNQGTYFLPPVTLQLVWGSTFLALAPILAAMRHWLHVGRAEHPAETGRAQPTQPTQRLRLRERLEQLKRLELRERLEHPEQDPRKSRELDIHRAFLPLTSALGVVVALFIIGKYSPPSIVFVFPFLYLAVGITVAKLVQGERSQRGDAVWNRSAFVRFIPYSIVLVTIAISGMGTTDVLTTWYASPLSPRSYSAYRSAITDALPTPLPAGTAVLGNVNAGFAFPPNTLRGYRDFARLPPRDSKALEAYLRREKIEFVLFPADELELIYRMRPVWNDVYGNPTRFYPQLRAILENSADRIAVISAPIYGMRLLRYVGRVDASVEVYRLKMERL